MICFIIFKSFKPGAAVFVIKISIKYLGYYCFTHIECGGIKQDIFRYRNKCDAILKIFSSIIIWLS